MDYEQPVAIEPAPEYVEIMCWFGAANYPDSATYRFGVKVLTRGLL